MTANSQRGVALLTILLLVVSITIVAGAMLASQKIAIRRSGVVFNQNQLLQDINVGQQLAVTMLRADMKLNDTDSMQDIWAQPLPPYNLGTHNIAVEMRDEASRFNINNLYHDGATDTAALAAFQRLLKALNVDSDIAIAVLDWQDTDKETYKDGGDESTVYSQQSGNGSDKALPNQPFINIEQLQEVRGVSAEVLASLRPYITAVPYYMPININTANPVVLAALVEGGTVAQMQALTELRDKHPLTSVDDLWQLPFLSVFDTEQRNALAPLLAVDSQAFMALITAKDNSNEGAARQRFATVLISKIDAAPATENNNSANGNDNNNNKKDAKVIKIISQRLWAFRPNF